VDAASRVEVIATATLHGAMKTLFPKLSGTLEGDPDRLADTARAEVRLAMGEFDSNDRMRDWKMKKELDPDKWPEAVFTLGKIEQVTRDGDRLRGRASGTLEYRGRKVTIEAEASGTLGPTEARAEARFKLNLNSVGVPPPKFLFLKVHEVVEVVVQLVGVAQSKI